MRTHTLGWRTLFFLGGGLLAGVIIGHAFDNAWCGLAIAALLLLAWHYWHMRQLAYYLWHEKRFHPPAARGAWGIVFDGLYRLQLRYRGRRKELARLLKRFRDGAEALPDGAVVFRNDRTIVWCNQLAQFLLGLRWPEDSGQRLDNLVRHPDFLAFLDNAERGAVLVLPSPTSTQRQLEIRIMPYEGGQSMLVVRDISQWLKLEQMRRDFIANVSHELRTPLTVVRGYLEMAEDPAAMPPQTWRKAHQLMQEQVRRMDTLVSQLIMLSKLEAAQKIDLANELDVPELLRAIVEEAQSLAGDKALTITSEIDPELVMHGDEMQMRSAFSNLIFNAVHYTPAPGKITVRWQRVGDVARFEVADDGDGIAPEHLSRLTERFYRVDKARSRKTGGSGLGLAIVKHALTHHNSQLNIQSELHQGSVFSFDIPANLLVHRHISRQA